MIVELINYYSLPINSKEVNKKNDVQILTTSTISSQHFSNISAFSVIFIILTIKLWLRQAGTLFKHIIVDLLPVDLWVLVVLGREQKSWSVLAPNGVTLAPNEKKNGLLSQFHYILAQRAKVYWNWSKKFPDLSYLGANLPLLGGTPYIPVTNTRLVLKNIFIVKSNIQLTK